MKRWATRLAAGLPLAFCLGAAQAEEAPIRAVATIGMIGDVAAHVGGSCVEVTTLMGPGVDPHLYQPGARDVQTFQDADVILYSGYSLEGQLGAVLKRFSQMKPTLAVAEASIEEGELIAVEGAYGIDPHLWMDAGLWSRIAPTIAQTLGEMRPDCADAMRANAESYGRQLAALHDWAGRAVATVPEQQRILVTAHDAFGYYGRAYGIRVEGIQGISTEAEASVADIRAAAARVAELGVPAVFVESTINPRTIQAVIDAAAQQGQEVRIGGELYSDAMGEAGTAGGTYIGMIYENTRNIVTALGGTPPAMPDALRDWAETWDVADASANVPAAQ
ncbi:metal ABC transporter solute-binding protein, Zn/Mn family [Antarcticirhabdus aurantiaca]|uniref:Zinc ABC transporter substrate-binding protein n=1 Tax=Antarcticirhabdus aurantiaca TaxID=2606717 RepID=A0ACD4NSM1_9HYPH|nr:zinc ABC transporter substrate-binding protein [Antarcticirhabdus aurantiaca]WAJ29784.1 zinc ABC transporter substrate-binding protein [Jeongeuplla avenae]